MYIHFKQNLGFGKNLIASINFFTKNTVENLLYLKHLFEFDFFTIFGLKICYLTNCQFIIVTFRRLVVDKGLI